MKKHSKVQRFAVTFAVIALLMSLLPTGAFAATWKNLNLKYITSYDSVSTQASKSSKIKKTGCYNLVMKGGNGIVRFTAPKTKTYKFTLSSLKSGEVDKCACVVGFCSISGSRYSYKTRIKTKEGYRPRLPVVSASMADGKTINLDGYKYRNIKTRSGKIRLKKGQKIYIVCQAKDMGNSLVPARMHLQIS